MDFTPPATSLIQFLTHANPPVKQEKVKGASNTYSKRYFTPRQLKKWDEFEFGCLESAYGGDLLREARREGRSLPHYPNICPEADCFVQNEPATTALINKWTKSIVTSALGPIKELFNPVIWRPGEGRLVRDVKSPPTPGVQRTQPPRLKKQATESKTSLSRLRPDSGSVSSPVSGTAVAPPGVERFPKEYKPASKWTSEGFFAHNPIDEDGEWVQGQDNTNHAMPIRQAFMYCIKHMCRYGCILSCEEAFIFRIKPLDERPSLDTPAIDKKLEEKLVKDAVMEYISIPWSSHSEDSEGDRKWTVNLALWFLHVLAGNHYEVDWDYVPLAAEDLNPKFGSVIQDRHHMEEAVMPGARDETTDNDSTEEEDMSERRVKSVAIKRKRSIDESDEEDRPNHSFSQRSFMSDR